MKKIARFLYLGRPTYGVLSENDEVILINGDPFDEWDVTDKIISISDNDLLAPLVPSQIIGVGLNYYDHAEECKFEIPDEPVLFIKGVNSVTGPFDEIILPKVAPKEVDYEGELVIVIGKKAKDIEESEAGRYIMGYTCGNDVTARDCQLRRDKQWARGKSFDSFCPIGPYIVSDINNDNLDIKTTINGVVVQKSNTSNMIFNCNKLVSYISKSMTLLPKTIIMTGTPSGVGCFKTPPVFLKKDDLIEVQIDKLGRLKNRVI